MMYTGSYPTDADVRIPEGYDGTMLIEDAQKDDTNIVDTVPANTSFLSGIFKGGFDSLFNSTILGRMNIGIEEILIGAAALFLLTSKNGDKESAIMLLLLLFVK